MVIELEPHEVAVLRAQRKELELQNYAAWRRRLLKRCPDFDEFADAVQKLKGYFPRGGVGLPGHGDAGAGLDLLDYNEALYLVAKFSSFGQNSADPFLGAERPAGLKGDLLRR